MTKRLEFDQLRAVLPQLTLEQARQLYAELGELIQSWEEAASAPPTITNPRREVVETRHLAGHLYQLEQVRCGKAGCKCAGIQGELHGPYWYAYWREDGKLKSRYVGKQFRVVQHEI